MAMAAQAQFSTLAVQAVIEVEAELVSFKPSGVNLGAQRDQSGADGIDARDTVFLLAFNAIARNVPLKLARQIFLNFSRRHTQIPVTSGECATIKPLDPAECQAWLLRRGQLQGKDRVDFDAADGCDAVSILKLRLGFFGHVDGSVGLERDNGDAEIVGGGVHKVPGQADFEGVAVVEIVGDEPAVQHQAGDIAGVVDTKRMGSFSRLASAGILMRHSAAASEVSVKRRHRHGPLDFSDGNFAKRPGGLHFFELSSEFHAGLSRSVIGLKNSF